MNQLEPCRLDALRAELTVLDQTRLPGEARYLTLKTAEEVRQAICTLTVRGAPCIGIAAAYGAYLGALALDAPDFAGFSRQFDGVCARLASARPTAVNLAWALGRMKRRAAAGQALPRPALLDSLRQEAEAIHQEDMEQNLRISAFGLELLRPGDGLLTHCNAGPMATSRYGTALGPILLGQERGYGFHVYADETRPLLQGARLTAFELLRAGVTVTLLCDSMAASVMQAGKVQAVLVGCDRVAANGDTANKIGTLGVAVLARHFGVPFYVCGPGSTIDFSAASGRDIPIEQRDPAEVTELWYQRPMAPQGCPVYNPAFDVTPNELITAIVTDRGVARPPYDQSLRALFSEE